MADKGKLLQQAQKHLAKGNLDKAIRVFQQLVDADPRDYRLLLRLADLQARAGRKKEAIVNYEKIAQIHIRDEFFPKAIAVYKTILRLSPDYLLAYEKLADLYKKQGLEGEAISQLQILYEVHEKKQSIDRMIDVLRLMSETDPENLGFQVRLGETLAKKGNKKEAAEAFAKAAMTLSRRGFHDRASELFNKIIVLNPENVAVRKELCSHYLESGHFEEARGEIEAILEAEPDDPRMVLLLGRILFKVGDFSGGTENVFRSIEMFQQQGDLDRVMKEFLFVAQVHLKNGELDEAEAFYGAIERAAPGRVEAIRGLISVGESRGDSSMKGPLLTALGNALAADGDLEGAREAFERVLQLDPHDEEARSLLESLPERAEEAAATPEPLDISDINDVLESTAHIEDSDEVEESVALTGAEVEMEDIQELADMISVSEDEDGEEEIWDDRPGEADAGEFQVDDSEMDDELLEFVVESPDDGYPTETSDSEALEGIGFPDVASETSLEDGLLEIDVYRKYGLMDKVMDILADLEARFPGDRGVLAKGLEVYTEAGSVRAAEVGADLVRALLDSEETGEAREVYREISRSFPDAPGVSALADLFPQDTGSASGTEGPGVELADVIARETLGADPSGEGDAVPRADGDPYTEEMEEADFFLSQDLLEDAEGIYNDILLKDPDHHGARVALTRLNAKSSPSPQPPAVPHRPDAPVTKPAPAVEAGEATSTVEVKGILTVKDSSPETDGFLDLADELRTELGKEFDAEPPARKPQEGPVTFEEIFAQFKKGIEETLGEQEYETHYNLGIAYKDMGLVDDAIRELEISSRDPHLLHESLSLMAMCFMEKSDHDSAVKTLLKAMESARQEHLAGLNFQLGQAYEAKREWGLSLQAYEKVRDLDGSMEGIGEAVDRVRDRMTGPQEEPPSTQPEEDSLDSMLSDLIREVEEISRESKDDPPSDDDDPSPKAKKDRVSYL
ncbi:MAG: tetratricopeptide repeat protein [bacterium]|nr:MAG: tetratricopeptide repeat protein [bacterium]